MTKKLYTYSQSKKKKKKVELRMRQIATQNVINQIMIVIKY